MADTRLVFGGVTFRGLKFPTASCCRAAPAASTRAISLVAGSVLDT